MIEITEGELLHLKDTLERCADEFDQLTEECDAFFNSGALEGVEESLEIVSSLLNVKLQEDINSEDITS